ncbi:MAG: hypothetical protein QOC95_2514 [Thermoleophilaceae bacterium]|jgi:ketosteroid isomerase-like protein|nr:hypothetical protein [Thermoleophilaceae bacterium]
MSKENVELVRRAFEAFSCGDLEAVSEVLDPAVSYTWVEPGPWDCHNADEVLRVAEERHSEAVAGPVRELIDAGDQIVLRLENPHAEAYGAAPGEDATTVVFTVSAGRIVSMHDYRSRSEALAAVGMM